MGINLIWNILVFIFGAVIGSFLNVCIYRLPLNQSIIHPPSRCRNCRSRLKAHDNLPILGYFLLAGRCRFCGMPFSLRYPLVELLTALVALLIYHFYGLTLQSIWLFIVAAALLVVLWVDIDHRIIPDEISLYGTFISLLLALCLPLIGQVWFVNFREALIGAFLAAGMLYAVSQLYLFFTSREGLGLGDVKLMGLVGACFGWQIALTTIFCGSLLGSLFGVGVMLKERRSSKYPIPFGPFLVGGCFMSFVVHELTK